jgi:hypothetical protein
VVIHQLIVPGALAKYRLAHTKRIIRGKENQMITIDRLPDKKAIKAALTLSQFGLVRKF